jgi:hypothetical protein
VEDKGETLPQESSVPRSYWLIAKQENSQIRMLTVAPSDEKAIPKLNTGRDSKRPGAQLETFQKGLTS